MTGPAPERAKALREFIDTKRKRLAMGILAPEAARLFELIADAEAELQRLAQKQRKSGSPARR